ncbi:MAG: cellulase family glycosylhydrolase, partial [Oscillospiraceae bacterium]
MKKKTILSVTALLLAVTIPAGCGSAPEPAEETSAPSQTETAAESTPPEESPVLVQDDIEEQSIKDMTSLDMIRAMGNGINLGNTLEAYNHNGYLGGANPDGFETGWGQPYTTAEMIQGMKDAGFDTIRIPVAWTNGMNYEEGDY